MANPIEREGVYHCGKLAAHYKWMFREQPIDDVGIDAHMEFTEVNGEVRQLLGLQIKSGQSWFKERKGEYIIFRDISEHQYNYWTTNSLPCIIVLYNPDNDECIWEKLTVKTIKKTKGGKGKGFFVKIPLNQLFLDKVSHQSLLAFTKLPEHIMNYNFLLSQKSFMQIIQRGGMIRLHSEEWVNKCSGAGTIELIINDKNGESKYLYPYHFPYTSYTEVFPKLFPWADFIADPDFYQSEDENLWLEENCYYDREEKQWIVWGDSFESFRKKLDPMRSINHYNEVAEYMLILSLNELGKSFLTIDNYVTQSQVYVSARPQNNTL